MIRVSALWQGLGPGLDPLGRLQTELLHQSPEEEALLHRATICQISLPRETVLSLVRKPLTILEAKASNRCKNLLRNPGLS